MSKNSYNNPVYKFDITWGDKLGLEGVAKSLDIDQPDAEIANMNQNFIVLKVPGYSFNEPAGKGYVAAHFHTYRILSSKKRTVQPNVNKPSHEIERFFCNYCIDTRVNKRK